MERVDHRIRFLFLIICEHRSKPDRDIQKHKNTKMKETKLFPESHVGPKSLARQVHQSHSSIQLIFY